MLPSLDRFPYSPIRARADFSWPEGKRVAVHVAINLEHFIFGGGGVNLDRETAPPNHRSYLWREYGNRVGIWRLLDLFDEMEIPMGVIANSAIYEHCPDVMAAFRARGDEVIGHGRTNSKPQSEMAED
ncbi:MAG: polysaccharide deacetylase, partial [Alphaproteobacteria bacterium]|nr:polysaccharide deacetylase [Alphaproteobacteria bacterium]